MLPISNYNLVCKDSLPLMGISLFISNMVSTEIIPFKHIIYVVSISVYTVKMTYIKSRAFILNTMHKR